MIAELLFSVKEKRKYKRMLPFLRALNRSANRLCLYFFPTNVMSELLFSWIDISKSPHFVKRLDTNDPNGSTVAPVQTTLQSSYSILLRYLNSVYLFPVQSTILKKSNNLMIQGVDQMFYIWRMWSGLLF